MIRADENDQSPREDDLEENVTTIEFGDEIDLHHFHFKDTGLAVQEFIRQGSESGLSRVRIVHGKGMSRKKEWVHAILEKDPRVDSFRDDGPNWGATIVFLKKGSGGCVTKPD